MRARRLVELDPDRHQPVAGVELGEIGVDVAHRRDPDGLRQRLGRDAEIGRDLPLRLDAQFRPLELGGRHRILDDRDRAHFAGDLVGRVVDDVDVGAGDDEREVALAVVLQEPVADVRLIGEHRADPELQVLLRRLALGLVDEVDDQRRLARLRPGAEDLPAEDQRRTDFGHRSQLLRDRAHDAIGVVEPRARRQFDGEQHPADVVGRDEARRQQARRPERGGEDQGADEERDPAMAHRRAHEARVAAHDRRRPSDPRRAGRAGNRRRSPA